jgi:hypothetical protein
VVDGNASKIRRLEETVEELREELKSVKRKVRQLEETRDTATSRRKDLVKAAPSTTSQATSKLPTRTTFNGHNGVGTPGPSNSDTIRHLEKDSPKQIIKLLALKLFRTLALKLFRADELANHSITGKRSVKSADVPRPALEGIKIV